jgi:transcriptional regulator with GAF, ATPase, and Fis domain
MNFDADIDAIIDEVLGDLGEFLGMDRVGYLKVNAQENSLMPTRQWFAEGIEQDRSVQYTDVSAQFPWLTARIIGNEPVTIDETDQFPDVATNERQYCENLGIQSFIMVPAMLGGKVVAALALDSMNSLHIWTDGIVRRLQIVTGMIANAQERVHRQRTEADIHNFDVLISRVSAAFINLSPEAVEGEIEKGLQAIAEMLDVDHISLSLPDDETCYNISHEWVSEVFECIQAKECLFRGKELPQDCTWLADRLRRNKSVHISKSSDWPAEAVAERAAEKQTGIQSVFIVPFEVKGQLAGRLVFNSVKQRAWPMELVTRMRSMAEIFCQALGRRDAEMRLLESYKEIESLKEQLQQENLYLKEEVKLTHNHDEIIGDSASLQATLIQVEQVAATNSTVLILGETGTGKELLARAIHNASSQKTKIMVKVNCAALPSSLVEAELFGREKGAYTGALTRELGRFEIADGSTIFLDEIGELSLELQAKLLRVLQDGEFERLGSSKTRKVNVRVLAATNRDLARAVENKQFRADLFYRLNVFPITVPPLRDRAEDIPQLVWAFVQEFSASMGKIIESIPATTMDSLKEYSWPGNIRELRNIIERAMIISNGPKLEIKPWTATSPRIGGSSRRLADIEREHVQSVVEATGWRIRGAGGAAEILGLKPTTLEARMKKLGLQRSKPR